MKYNLTFNEALQALYDNEGWVQGDNFVDGLVIMFDCGSVSGKKYIHLYNFSGQGNSRYCPLYITRGLMNQKFRVVSTQPDALRKI